MTAPLRVTVVADGAATAGDYAVLDCAVAAGTSLDAHRPSREDAVLVVLSGALELTLADGIRTVAAGQSIALARRTPRRILALSDTRVLCVATPAGIEALVPLTGDADVDPDDLAALLTHAGVALLSARWGPVGAPPHDAVIGL